MEENGGLKWLLIILLLIIIAAVIYFLYGGSDSSSSRSSKRSSDGFSFNKKVKNASSKTTSDSSSYSNIDNGPLFGGKSRVPAKNKASHIKAVAGLNNFTWDDGEYYKSTLTPLEPMKQSAYNEFFDANIKPMIDASGFNTAMVPLMQQAEQHPVFLQASDLYKKGRYKEAAELFANLADKSTNIYLRSLALGYLTDIYKKTGDAVQEAKAQNAMLAVNAQLYFKAFPDIGDSLKKAYPKSDTAMKTFLKADTGKSDFKAPNAGNSDFKTPDMK